MNTQALIVQTMGRHITESKTKRHELEKHNVCELGGFTTEQNKQVIP